MLISLVTAGNLAIPVYFLSNEAIGVIFDKSRTAIYVLSPRL